MSIFGQGRIFSVLSDRACDAILDKNFNQELWGCMKCPEPEVAPHLQRQSVAFALRSPPELGERGQWLATH